MHAELKSVAFTRFIADISNTTARDDKIFNIRTVIQGVGLKKRWDGDERARPDV